MTYLHLFLSLLLILSGCLIFVCNNPVYSVLFLILSFCISAIILFLFKIEFLGLIFIMVYVGAVAILFIFVIMMIETKTVKSKTIFPNYSYFWLFIMLLSFAQISFYINSSFFNSFDFNVIVNNYNNVLLSINSSSNIEVIGQSLYNNYSIAFLLAGFILLIALVGSICLTLNFKEITKIKETDLKQISREFYSLNLFK